MRRGAKGTLIIWHSFSTSAHTISYDQIKVTTAYRRRCVDRPQNFESIFGQGFVGSLVEKVIEFSKQSGDNSFEGAGDVKIVTDGYGGMDETPRESPEVIDDIYSCENG